MKHARYSLFLLVAMVSFSVVSACNTGDNKDGDAKKARTVFSLSEASTGLPSQGLWRQGVAFHDMNGDGHMDILAPPPRNGGEAYPVPVVWYGDGKGAWRESLLDMPGHVEGYGDIAVADFNQDGIPDIGLAIHAGGLKAFKGTGKKTYADFSGGLPPSKDFTSRALLSADVNGDGTMDMAAVSEGPFGGGCANPQGIMVCSPGDTGWTCEPASPEKSLVKHLYADTMAAGDVNADGRPDLAIGSLFADKNFIVWINGGDGDFVPFNGGLPQGKIYHAVALADLNGDGRDDLVAVISGFGREGFAGIKAFLSREEGFEDISDGLPAETPYRRVAVGDLNNDGSREIVGGTSAGGITIFYQEGNGWAPAQIKGLPTQGMENIYGIHCMDLNGDGHKDIVVNYASPEGDEGGIRVFLNSRGKK